MNHIRTKSGRLVDPFNLTPDDVRSVDFIHAMCCINRFTGHAKYPYSVGQHSIVLYKHVPKELRKAALIHDWAEAFFNDLASPVKKKFNSYRAYEKEALRVITDTMQVPWSDIVAVSPYDKRMYVDERNALFDVIDELGMGDDRTALEVAPWFFRERDWRDVALEYHRLMEQEFYLGN